MDSSALQARVAAIIDLPLHRFLGVSLIDADDPAAGATFVVDEPTQGPGGWLHGGVVYTLLDMTCYLALLPHLAEDKIAVSHAVNISLMKGVPGGSTVRLTAEVVRVGRSLAFLRAEARAEGHVVATATVTKSIIPG
ncbi:PaaI family thioesterase [Cumulibacter manganitolerans]|uniref:PaaI family thioesterase n=1 Tax=Cumulibacter manganitolerans TaxID=1884992 RepID=UPI001E52C579|nr:PaaI family thioesterase [Cumulibacter manganitolerans]